MLGNAATAERGLAVHGFGNLIGTNIDGLDPDGNMGNGSNGLVVSNANVGLIIIGDQSSNNLIHGNRVGVGAAGEPIANWWRGVDLGVGAHDNTLEGNEIANNGHAGVLLYNDTTDRNRISGNAIYDNGGIGIDLSPNIPGGPNENTPSPIVEWAQRAGPNLLMHVRLDATPRASYEVQLFSDAGCTFSQRQNFAGTRTVRTNGQGTARFSAVVLRVAGHSWVSATAIDAIGNTSEFSDCVALRR